MRTPLLLILLIPFSGLFLLAAEKEELKKETTETSRKVVKHTSERKPAVQDCLVNKEAVGDISRLKAELAEKEKAIEAREVELKSKELALEEELKKLDEIRKEISGIEANNKEKIQENVSKLVQTYEKMSPKAAASLISQLDDRIAVNTLSSIEPTRLAKIMNVMDPVTSSRFSELLTLGKTNKKKVPNRTLTGAKEEGGI